MSKILMYVRRRIRGTARLVAIYRSLKLARFRVFALGLGTYGRVSLQLHTPARHMCVCVGQG
jgi:hypothetical protein